MAQSTTNYRDIKASAEKIFNALMSREGLEFFQAPDEMTAKVHHFDKRIGGGYEMSLFYPDSEKKMKGKTNEKEDRFHSTYIDIVPNEKIVEEIKFESGDADFTEPMIMEITLVPGSVGTRVTFVFKNIPKGIKPEDNEAGSISTLEKLAKYVEA